MIKLNDSVENRPSASSGFGVAKKLEVNFLVSF
jgi:hypothetical protein